MGPSPALSKDPCVSLKRGIDRDVVRAAQPMAGWLGLARPRNFPKPSYFLYLGPLAAWPRGTIPLHISACALASGYGGGGRGRVSFSWSSGHTANAPWRPLDEDGRLETRSVLPSPPLCAHLLGASGELPCVAHPKMQGLTQARASDLNRHRWNRKKGS